VSGNVDMIMDVMMEVHKDDEKITSDIGNSILILGVPGTGKTTIIREMAKNLSEKFNVCVVDTSNDFRIRDFLGE